MRVFAGAGEASGDRILAALLKGLRAHFPDLEASGFGGPLSETQGLKSLLPIQQLAVSGVGDVFRRGVFLTSAYLRLKKALREFQPDLVLQVDYPGMNVGLVRYAKRLGLRVHYVAPPQLWAYRNPGPRLHRLRRSLNGVSLQVLFPFELKFYEPWATRLCQGHFFSAPSGSPPFGDRLLLCPGSRREVLRRNLPLWLQQVSDWKNGIDILTPKYLVKDVEVAVAEWSAGLRLRSATGGLYRGPAILADSEEAFSRAASAISFPGTMTLELFLHRIPTSVWAVLDPLTLWMGRRKLRNRFTALPNLLLDKEVFPEWVGTAKNFKRQPPILQNASDISDEDRIAIQKKMGLFNGVETGVQACLELLL